MKPDLPTLLALLAACSLAAIPAAAHEAEEGRVIVKYRSTAQPGQAQQHVDRATRLGQRLGLKLRHGREINARTQVLFGQGVSSEELAARLGRDADVEYAAPDRLRTIRALPNDPLFAQQWYLQAGQPAAIRATSAWDQTTGNAAVVVAVLDTGVRYEHPDLAAKLLPGYDFVANAANAGDGDGRDADASDPGDFISQEDLDSTAFRAVCGSSQTLKSSSWHGTRVSGILAAASNNGNGIAGTSWGARILPVRVLGKCGGYDSDIIAGMRWAAGLSVPGIPANANPARTLNLSLGGGGSCTSAYRDTIAELAQRKVLVVTVAGNETGPVNTPGNCPGVLTVAGVRHVGTKVGYSSMGPQVAISAPAGNCVNIGGNCDYFIATTTNLGSSTPAGNGYTSSTDSRISVGTSFSAPQAAGVAALMLSVNPALGPTEIINRIKASARSFPQDPVLPTCPAVSSTGDNAGQCNCTTSTCGAGLLDAPGAVTAALAPAVVIRTLDPLVPGTTITLDGSDSQAASGRTIVAWQWALVSAPAGAALTAFNSAGSGLQTTTAGSYTLALTVTDDQGASSTAQITLSVGSVPGGGGGSPGIGGGGGGGGGGALDGPSFLGLMGMLTLAYLGGRRRPRISPQKPPAR